MVRHRRLPLNTCAYFTLSASIHALKLDIGRIQSCGIRLWRGSSSSSSRCCRCGAIRPYSLHHHCNVVLLATNTHLTSSPVVGEELSDAHTAGLSTFSNTHFHVGVRILRAEDQAPELSSAPKDQLSLVCPICYREISNKADSRSPSTVSVGNSQAI